MKPGFSLLFYLLLGSGIFYRLSGQNLNPENDILYNDREVALIEIVMDSSDKLFLLDNANKDNEDYLHARFRFKNSNIDTLLIDVGIRLRGNTSRSHPKKSFKIDFKEFGLPKFYGYKKFNLKADNNDPSQIRELFTLKTFRWANVPAARAFHARVYMNGEYMGLYTNVEQIDDEFVLSRFGNDTGNLYKCHWPVTLENDGQISNEIQFELETNQEENDRHILANFVRVLNETSDPDFKVEIEKVLNVESAIRYFAVEAITGHWDGYSYLKNNVYIYENPDNGLIEIIPYDVDNTFGIDWIGRDWAQRDLLDWAKHGEPRPLNTRLLAVKEYREMYMAELNKLIENYFSEEVLFPEFDFYRELISSAIATDSYYPKTFGFSLSHFFNSFDKQVANHVPYGLKPYVQTRISFARQQIPVTVSAIENDLAFFSIYPNPSDGNFIFISGTAEKDEKSRFKIYNSTGQSVSFQEFYLGNAHKLVFNQPLSPGMYILGTETDRKKFIVH